MAVQIIVKNSNVEDKRPTGPQLANGEIALNYNEAGAFLTCKDTNGATRLHLMHPLSSACGSNPAA
jgi:hypothetical protein